MIKGCVTLRLAWRQRSVLVVPGRMCIQWRSSGCSLFTGRLWRLGWTPGHILNLPFLPAPPFPQEHPSPDRLPTSPRAPPRLRPVPAATMNSSPHGSRASVDILEELQLIAAQNLEKLDINKYYEVVCELGKGTYGKVDLVIHKIRGNWFWSATRSISPPSPPNSSPPPAAKLAQWRCSRRCRCSGALTCVTGNMNEGKILNEFPRNTKIVNFGGQVDEMSLHQLLCQNKGKITFVKINTRLLKNISGIIFSRISESVSPSNVWNTVKKKKCFNLTRFFFFCTVIKDFQEEKLFLLMWESKREKKCGEFCVIIL